MPIAARESKTRVAGRKSQAASAQSTLSDEQADLIDAQTAASLLGVKRQTLYAYVSRGLIRVTPRSGNRPNMYRRLDIEALRGGRGRGGAADAVDQSTRWSTGTTLATAVTSITVEGPRYRGKLATDLASRRRTFEDCADLLWTGVLPAQSFPWDPPYIPDSFLEFTRILGGVTKTAWSRQMLSLLTGAYAASLGRNPETALGAPVLAGRQLLQILAPAFGLLRKNSRYVPVQKPTPLSNVVATSAGIVPSQEALHAIDCCLILSADHELAPSTFAARVAASAAADIFSCVGSGFGTFEGPMTGLGCDEPERLLKSARSPKDYVATLKDYKVRKEALLGYNHPFYPAGDPRALFLLQIARDLNSTDTTAKLVLDCIDAATQEMEVVPSLAIGLVAVSAALRMPEESPGTLMAIGRASGWIAHIFEQRLSGTLILPRTRYIGPAD